MQFTFAGSWAELKEFSFCTQEGASDQSYLAKKKKPKQIKNTTKNKTSD